MAYPNSSRKPQGENTKTVMRREIIESQHCLGVANVKYHLIIFHLVRLCIGQLLYLLPYA